MRFNPSELHPRLFAATDRLTSGMFAGHMQDPEFIKAIGSHGGAWWRAYGKAFMALSAVSIAGIAAVGYLGKQIGESWMGFAAFFLVVVLFGILYQRNRRQLTSEELEALMPALDLDPVEVAYAEAILALANSQLPPEDRSSLMKDLYRLLDEESTLVRQEKALHQVVSKAGFDALDAEAKRLEERATSARDEEARKSFERSLEAVRARMDHQERFAPYMERIEAHRELIRQTLLGVKETLGRTKIAPGISAPDWQGLREVLAQVEQQAESVDRAVAELNALS